MTSVPPIPTPEGEAKAGPVRRTILVVDDQEVLRNILIHVLTRQGYQVLSATDGLDALRTIVAYPGKIDIVITDLMMPIMDGDEFLEYLAVLRPRMKAICLSAASSEVSLRRAVLTLPKPFSLQGVVRTVTEVLAASPEPVQEADDVRGGTRRRTAAAVRQTP